MIHSELRKEDVRRSNVISDFLDKHFYAVHTTQFERVNDTERQVQGIDTIFTFQGHEYTCDEKASVRYINKNLRTFSFELSFLRKSGETTDGWLLSEKDINNSFLLCWIDRAKSDTPQDESDILEMEIALVRREAILAYLQHFGWDKRKLLRKARRIREQYHENLGSIETNGCKFVFSDKLVEKPVNVLISRDTLLEISDFHKIL